MHSDTECPYCGKGVEICHDDGQGYAEDEIHEQECEHCEKVFTFTTSISYDYDTTKAPCLNGGEHDFKETKTWPKKYTKLECSYCGRRKDLSPERLAELTD